MIVLLIASYEIHRSQVYSAHAEALAKFNQGIPLSELPQKFGLKLMTNVCASPAEFAEALVDEMIRPQWELNLKMVSKKALQHLELQYHGIVNAHNVTYEFEPLPMSAGMPATFLIHELTAKNAGIAKVTSLYLLEEIAGRDGMLRVSYFTQVSNEDEARAKIKSIASLMTTIQCIDRKG